jgi:hypothetical protein
MLKFKMCRGWKRGEKEGEEFLTYERGELFGYLEKVISESKREGRQEMFTEIESEITKHKFNTDMDGWDIVPKLMATMQLIKSKVFFGEDLPKQRKF